jgi:hypothetical protein
MSLTGANSPDQGLRRVHIRKLAAILGKLPGSERARRP